MHGCLGTVLAPRDAKEKRGDLKWLLESPEISELPRQPARPRRTRPLREKPLLCSPRAPSGLRCHGHPEGCGCAGPCQRVCDFSAQCRDSERGEAHESR